MDIAVDLGSDRTRVFIENKGIVLDEASVVAFDVDENAPVCQKFASACKSLSLNCELVSTFGGSDNNVLFGHSIRGLVVSTGMHNCHSVNEYTTTKMLTDAASLALELMK